jgi:DNA-binding transcriptional regulator LsrR (DeoR family)
VQVHHKITCCLEVATILRKRYDLVVCEVVPSNEDSPDQVLRKIAVAGAQIMESYLSEPQPKIIALSSGRTMKAVTGSSTRR